MNYHIPIYVAKKKTIKWALVFFIAGVSLIVYDEINTTEAFSVITMILLACFVLHIIFTYVQLQSSFFKYNDKKLTFKMFRNLKEIQINLASIEKITVY